MTNRNCQGDFFTTDAGRFYRCIYDGAVIKSGTLLDGKCPHCNRMMDATELADVETRTVTLKEFRHPSFGWLGYEQTIG